MITRSIQVDAIDQLHQIRDELTVVWLAMGSSDLEHDGALTPVREHIHGLQNRVRDICQMMERGA